MKPILHLIVFALMLLAAPMCAAQDEKDNLSVEASGLRVVAPATEDSMRAFNWFPGTTVALLVKSPAGGLIQFDSKNSALAKFIDEKGNDLLAKPAQAGPMTGNIGFSLFSKTSTDGKACAIEVNSPNVPAKGSAFVKLDGVITMLSATEKKEFVQKDVPIRDGSKIAVDKLELTIEKVGKADVGDEPLTLAVRASRELDEVAAIKFFKADGAEIKSRSVGSSLMGVLGSMTVEWYYNLAEKADVATVKVYLWTDLQKKKIPFNLTVTAGL